jgi:hypothetical protein
LSSHAPADWLNERECKGFPSSRPAAAGRRLSLRPLGFVALFSATDASRAETSGVPETRGAGAGSACVETLCLSQQGPLAICLFGVPSRLPAMSSAWPTRVRRNAYPHRWSP